MATEPNAAPAQAPTWSDSPIENELPTYRALSGWSVASLILGIISLVAFASLNFLIASASAIAAGAFALRQIRRLPDQLTGTGPANLGIALGLITGLAAPTISVVQHSIVERQARAYGDQLAATLKEKGLAEAYWLSQPAPRRAASNPEQMLADAEASARQDQMAGGDPRLNTLRAMATRVASSDSQHIHLDGVEARGFDGVKPYAFLRVMLDGPKTDQFPEDRQFALLRVEAMTYEGARQWYLQDVTFPYESGSQAKVVDSAHGHDH